jgi:hypothetical protein
MRSIAPTLAQYLGARLDGAEGKVLALGASE